MAKLTGAAQCVVLLHGLARSEASMLPLQSALLDQGYLVVNQGYPSTDFPIDELSRRTLPPAVESCRSQQARHIHFVTHSLGSILLRHYLEHQAMAEVGRVVMLAPPNQGTQITDHYRNVPGFAYFFGPAVLQLGTGTDSVPLRLGPVPVDTAVIAGTSSINLILSLSLPNPDDGKVSVASTRVEGMCAHLQVPIAHPFIMKKRHVIDEVIMYLGTGRFRSEHAEYPDCSHRQQTLEATRAGS